MQYSLSFAMFENIYLRTTVHSTVYYEHIKIIFLGSVHFTCLETSGHNPSKQNFVQNIIMVS